MLSNHKRTVCSELFLFHLEKAPKEIEYSLGDSLRAENVLETSIELTLYGHNQDQLHSAMEKFREMAREDYKRKDFTDPGLKTLNDKQVLIVMLVFKI